MGHYDEIQKAYADQLEEPEMRPQLIREWVRLREVLRKHEATATGIELDRLAAATKMEVSLRADATALRRQYLANAGTRDVAMINGWVKQQNNIRDNFTDLQSELNGRAFKDVEDASRASIMNQAAGRSAGQAGWDTLLGTATAAGSILLGANPAAHMVLTHGKAQFQPFDPSNHGQVTVARYNQLVAAAEQKQAQITNLEKEFNEESKGLLAAQKAVADRPNEARTIIEQLAKRKPQQLTGFDTEDIRKAIQDGMDDDPQIQDMRKQSDYLWGEITGDGRDDSKRAAFASLLSRPKFQEWAKENNFVVGNAEVVRDDEGHVTSVTSFVPGKDLMLAYEISKKQLAKRPTAGAPGPLIARKGERDLVRVVKKDGSVLLGKTLPGQAADDAGSMRIATGGGEVYLTKGDIKSSQVVKSRRLPLGKALGSTVRAERGLAAQRRAERAYEALLSSGKLDPVEEGEMPEAEDQPEAPPPPPEAPPPKPPPEEEAKAPTEPPSSRTASLLGAPAAQESGVPSAKDLNDGRKRRRRRGRA